MSKPLFATAAGVIAAMMAAPAASADIYAGAGYTVFGGDFNDIPATTIRAGLTFNPFLGAEGEASFGLDDADGLDNQYGAFAVGRVPIPFVADLFARVGYSNFSFTGGVDGGGLAYGAGAEVSLLFLRGRLEYTRYEVEDAQTDAVSASVLVRF